MPPHPSLQSRLWVQHLSSLRGSGTALCFSGKCRTEGPGPLRPVTGCCWGMILRGSGPCRPPPPASGHGQGTVMAWGTPRCTEEQPVPGHALLRSGGQHQAKGGGFGVQSGTAGTGALAKCLPSASWQHAQGSFRSNTAEQIGASANCSVLGSG